MTTIRPPAFAGTFYPEDEKDLKNDVERYIKNAKTTKFDGKIKALISPHAGFPYSGPVAASGYSLLKGKKYRKIIIIGTSHRMMFQGIALTNFSFWKTPLGNIPASKASEELESDFNFKLINEAHAFEHSIEVQLPFLQVVLEDFSITPLLTGRIGNYEEIAEKLTKYAGEDTLFIVSADLSHYLPYKNAQERDKQTIDKIINFDTNIDPEESCGSSGTITLIEMAKTLKWKSKLLDYRNSGDTAGDKKEVVGYASILFYE